MPKETSVLIATLAVVFLLRFLQGPFLKDDPLFLKRFILSASAGLFLLIAINKLILAPELAPLSIPFGLGAFIIYAFELMGDKPSRGKPTRDKPSRPALNLWLRPVALCCLSFISFTFYGLNGIIIIIPTFLLSTSHHCKKPEATSQK